MLELFFDWLFVAFVITIIHNGLLHRILFLCRTVKSVIVQDSVHLWMAGRKKLTQSLPQA